MKLVSLTIVRNDGWCIGPALREMLRWVDDAVVLIHASTDDTEAQVEAVAKEDRQRVHIISEPDPVWREMRCRQRTLDLARGIGGTHFAIVDADEMLTENLIPTIRSTIEYLSPGLVLQPPWICCWRSLHQHRADNSIWSRSWVSMAFADEPTLHWQARQVGPAVEYDFHRRQPFNTDAAPRMIGAGAGGLLHFQHANWNRLLWKQLLYRLVEMVRWPEFGVDAINQKYNGTSDEQGIKLVPIPESWKPPGMKALDVDREPWQMAEVRRMVREHGWEKFKGVDFLGLEGQI